MITCQKRKKKNFYNDNISDFNKVAKQKSNFFDKEHTPKAMT